MRKTKFVALLLVVAIVASMVVPSVSAAGDYTLSIVDKATGAATINANAGDTVDVYVTISNNPGVSCVAINVSVPEGWSIKAAQNQKLFMGDAADQASSDNYTPGPNKDYFLWLMATGTQGDDFEEIAGGKLLTQNGNLVLVRYQIPEDAQTGAYTISVTPDLTNCFHSNVDGNGYIIPGGGKTNQAPATESLTINVQGTEPEVPAGAACPEHTDVTEWTEVAENAWADGGAIAAGHYKLTGNQATTAALTVAGNVCIDLNGYNITAGAKATSGSYRAFEIAEGAHLVIADSAETDGVISGGRIRAGAENLTVDGKCAGGNIYNAGTFTLYGGVVAGGVATSGSVNYNNYGGNIYGTADSVINIKGGQVKDGALSKGTLCYGTSKSGGGYGGNIYTAGTLNITDGVISGGHYDGYNDPTVDKYNGNNRIANKVYGGNIALVSGSVMNMSGGSVIDGSIVNNLHTTTTSANTIHAFGGNIYAISADINITGGTIANGRVEAGAYTSASFTEDSPEPTHSVTVRGGNIYITSGTTLNIENATVIGGVAEQSRDNSAGFDKETGLQTTSYGNSQGGNIYVSSGSVTIKNSIISDGQSDYRGGNIAIGTGTLDIVDSKILNGTLRNEFNRSVTGEIGELYELGTAARGADIYASGDITINISGDTVFAGANGGDYTAGQSINVRGNTIVNISGGDLSDKSSAFDGSGAITLTGGKLKNDYEQLGEAITVGENKAVVMTGSVYAPVADLAAALAAAQAGDKVIMLADATASDVAVPAGATLDLYGYKLTANSVTAAVGSAQIIDSKGTGLLATESASFSADNAQLPIKTADGYIFETVKFAEQLDAENKLYKFYIKGEAAATLIDDAILAGESVSIDVIVTWTNGEEPMQKPFTLSDEFLAQYAGNWDTKMIVLTFASDISQYPDLTCTAQITINGVTVTA